MRGGRSSGWEHLALLHNLREERMDANRRTQPRSSGVALSFPRTIAAYMPDPSASAAAPPWAVLPKFPLLPKVSPLARQCEARGLGNFHTVADRVYRLPYGRNRDRSSLLSVLQEGRGTCSTKHALLAALALEHGVELPLMLGIYEMSGANTPGVGPVLRQAGLSALPEAHCYLLWGKSRVDLTGLDAPTERHFLQEERIRPADIDGYKARRHREYLDQWRAAKGLSAMWSVEALWAVRERCIAALAAR
jgi:hypothetical protein